MAGRADAQHGRHQESAGRRRAASRRAARRRQPPRRLQPARRRGREPRPTQAGRASRRPRAAWGSRPPRSMGRARECRRRSRWIPTTRGCSRSSLAANVTLNALAVAALQAGLPSTATLPERRSSTSACVASTAVDARGAQPASPVQLRARIDELTPPRGGVTRGHAAQQSGGSRECGAERWAPPDAQHAAELVAGYSRRLERPAA